MKSPISGPVLLSWGVEHPKDGGNGSSTRFGAVAPYPGAEGGSKRPASWYLFVYL